MVLMSRRLKPSNFSGCRLRFQAANLQLADDAQVSSWVSTSSPFLVLTQGTAANRPLFKWNVINGLPVVRFAATDALFSSSDLGIQQPLTIFVVLNWTTDNDTNQIVYDANGGGNARLQINAASSPTRVAQFAGTTLTGATTSFPTSKWYIVSSIFDGANSETWLNGVSEVSGDAGTADPVGFAIGIITANSFLGDIAELIVFNQRMYELDRKRVERYLSKKYNIKLYE